MFFHHLRGSFCLVLSTTPNVFSIYVKKRFSLFSIKLPVKKIHPDENMIFIGKLLVNLDYLFRSSYMSV